MSEITLRTFSEPTNIVIYGTCDTWRLSFGGEMTPLTEEQRSLLEKIDAEGYSIGLTDDECSCYVDNHFFDTQGFLTVLTEDEFDVLKDLEESDFMSIYFVSDFVGSVVTGLYIEICEDESPSKCKYQLCKLREGTEDEKYLIHRRELPDGDEDEDDDLEYEVLVHLRGEQTSKLLTSLEDIREEED